MLYLKNEDKRNEAFLLNEKEKNQTFIRALIFSSMHTMNQVISHSSMQESKSLSRGRRTQDLLQKYAIFTSHKLFPHTYL